MDDTYHLSAIILKRDDFRENDSRVFVFSKEKGKLELVARGTKKTKSKLAGHLEPFNLVEIMAIRGRNFDYVGTALSSECFFDLKNDLEKLDLAIRCISVFSEAVKFDDANDSCELYDLLNKCLINLNSIKSTEIIIYYIFLLKLIIKLGYSPVIDECTVCGRVSDGNFLFSNISGGLVCGQCVKKSFSAFEISAKVLSAIKYFKNPDVFDFAMLNEVERKEFSKVISSFCFYVSESKIK